MKRGRKRKFYAEEAKRLAESGSTIQEIAASLLVHYNSVRYLFISDKTEYVKGKVGRPKKEIKDGI